MLALNQIKQQGKVRVASYKEFEGRRSISKNIKKVNNRQYGGGRGRERWGELNKLRINWG